MLLAILKLQVLIAINEWVVNLNCFLHPCLNYLNSGKTCIHTESDAIVASKLIRNQKRCTQSIHNKV